MGAWHETEWHFKLTASFLRQIVLATFFGLNANNHDVSYRATCSSFFMYTVRLYMRPHDLDEQYIVHTGI